MKRKNKIISFGLVILLLLFSVTPAYAAVSVTPTNITVVNNAGQADLVTVNGLAVGDVVKVYMAAPPSIVKATGTVSIGTSITLSYPQLDPGDDGADSIYVTVTSPLSTESAAAVILMTAVPESTSLLQSQITVNNYAGIPDNVVVINQFVRDVDGNIVLDGNGNPTPTGSILTNGDVIKVYLGVGGTPIGVGYVDLTGKATVGIGLTNLPAAAGGVVYVNVTKVGLKESIKTSAPFAPEAQSGVLISSQVKITNNALIPDIVKVDGLVADDTIKVYSAAVGGTALAIGKAVKQADNSYLAQMTVSTAGTAAGSLFLSLTNKGKMEGIRVSFAYDAAPVTPPLDAAFITITNNSLIKDTIYVPELNPGDIIKVYRLGSLAPLGSASVLAGRTDATISVPQLSEDAGLVNITLTKLGYTESLPVEKSYPAEAVSDTLIAAQITIANNFELPDSIKVTGLNPGDVVKAYRFVDSAASFGLASVLTDKHEAVITTAQLGAAEGLIYITVSSLGKLESNPFEMHYAAEATSIAPVASSDPVTNEIIITNNTGKADTVLVKGLNVADKVTIYRDATITTPINVTFVPVGKDQVLISITQLGIDADSVFVSVKSVGKMESDRAEQNYDAEPLTNPVDVGQIAITNLAGLPDTLSVGGLNKGQIVKVYANIDSTSPLTYGVATSAILTTNITVNLTYSQLGAGAEDVWVSLTTPGMRESIRLSKVFAGETISTAIDASSIIVTNNTGKSDTINITATPLSTIKIYRTNDLLTKTFLISGIVPTSGVLVLSYPNLGNTADSIYVTIARKGERESATRTEVPYSAAAKSTAPYAGPTPPSNVTVANNAGKSDLVVVSDLLVGDVVRVYRDNILTNTRTMAQYIIPLGKSYATIPILQLGSDAGSIFVSVQSPNKLESDRTEITYIAEKISVSPDVAGITIINNPGVDFILLTGLKTADVVKVYTTSSTPSLLAVVTLGQGVTYATFNIKQLGQAGGSVAFTVTSSNCKESPKTIKTFDAEVVIP